ncbi:hypothetical protein EHM92_06390, partial [bacterium]
MSFVCPWRIVFSLPGFLFLSLPAHTQVTQIRPMDVFAGLRAGSIHRTSSPSATSDSLHPFDGNPNSDQLVTGSDSLVVTLQFDSVTQIRAAKVFCLSAGRWSMAVANSLSDLDAKTGSFAALVSGRPYLYRAWDSVAFPQVSFRFARLTLRDTVYFSFIDLGEWTLMNSVTFTKLAILPYPPRVIPGGTLPLRVGMQDS